MYYNLALCCLTTLADIEVACYSSEGIDAVKEALKAGLTLSTEESPIKINLIAPPLYVVTTVNVDKDKGVRLLEEVGYTREVLRSFSFSVPAPFPLLQDFLPP